MQAEEKFARAINGFTQPLNRWQVASWLVMAFLVLSFYTLSVPVLPRQAQVVCATSYSAFFLAVLILGVLCTLSDPTDPVVTQERLSRVKREPFDYRNYTQICTICKTHVLELSKHCGYCDRCVDGFDHHCKWLNNCIGSKNYRIFVWLIATLQGLTSFQIIVDVYVSARVLDSNDETDVVYQIYKDKVFYVALLMSSASLSLVIWLMNGNLIGMHIWLHFNKLTTYEYILKVRERRKASKSKVLPAHMEPSTVNQEESLDRTQIGKTLELKTPPKNYQEIIMSSHKGPFDGYSSCLRGSSPIEDSASM